MEEAKERILEFYKEAAVDCLKALEQAEETKLGDLYRELFAEKYGRRQAYARILTEVCGVSPAELQRILDDITY